MTTTTTTPSTTTKTRSPSSVASLRKVIQDAEKARARLLRSEAREAAVAKKVAEAESKESEQRRRQDTLEWLSKDLPVLLREAIINGVGEIQVPGWYDRVVLQKSGLNLRHRFHDRMNWGDGDYEEGWTETYVEVEDLVNTAKAPRSKKS